MVKIRDGPVGNQPALAVIGVDLDGLKDILGMWAGDGDGGSAKFWLAVLTELKNRGVAVVFFLVCDGRKGLPSSVGERDLADGHRKRRRQRSEMGWLGMRPPPVPPAAPISLRTK